MESLFTEENIKLFFILFGAGFITIFIMALTNKVVIFKDGGDLMTTVGLILAPIGGHVGFGSEEQTLGDTFDHFCHH